MLSFEKIPDIKGYLVLNEDGAIISSGGELENSEHVANIVLTLISVTDRLGPDDDVYKKISVTFKNCSYIICLSNKKTYIAKKKFHPPPVSLIELDEEFASELSTNSLI